MVEQSNENKAAPKDAEKITKTPKSPERLLKYLRAHSEDRGIMADLRCALVDSKRYRAWAYLGRFGGIGDNHAQRTVQTIAGLYATHPEETTQGNFGLLSRNLLSADERDKLDKAEGVGPITRRFQHLLAADGEEIFDRVIRFVLRAKAEDCRVNYEELYESLFCWQYTDSADRVRTRWAQSFWTPNAEEEIEE